ncbi:unnamed protein product [Gongylonema pulchrum]|uniref:Uncharacterized protein n=1 Tax=Gongylonema pulchrum TaxID=637853 RepID=A0A183DM72_9BILA|nr:unnamed protein product [Gongylonema pulchrum]
MLYQFISLPVLFDLCFILHLADAFVDVRHRFGLKEMPSKVKYQILEECYPIFLKFFQEPRRAVRFIEILRFYNAKTF